MEWRAIRTAATVRGKLVSDEALGDGDTIEAALKFRIWSFVDGLGLSPLRIAAG